MKLVYIHHAERDMSSIAEWGTLERTFDDITESGKKRTEFLAEK